MASLKRRRDGPVSGAASDQNAAPKKQCSADQKHKKAYECRKQLEERFIDKMDKLPDGEIGLLLIIPLSKQGPVRIRSNNLTAEQTCAMLDALNDALPFRDRRLERWVEKCQDSEVRAKSKQRSTGRGVVSADEDVPGTASGSESGGGDSELDEGEEVEEEDSIGGNQEEFHDVGDSELVEGEEEEGEQQESGTEAPEDSMEVNDELEQLLEEMLEQAHKATNKQELSLQDLDKQQRGWYDAMELFLLSGTAKDWNTWTTRYLTQHFATEFGVEYKVIRPVVILAIKCCASSSQPAKDATAAAAKTHAKAGDAPTRPSGAADSSPAAQQQPAEGRPPRAAKCRAAAVWMQAMLDNSGGESSSNPRKAQPSAALTQLKPKGAVQKAVANARTADDLKKVLQKLGMDVAEGKVSVQQAQADLQFAAAAVDTKEEPWCRKGVAKAIDNAKACVHLKQLQALRSS